MNPQLRRTLLYGALLWAIMFACFIVSIPTYYTETVQTRPGMTQVSSGDVNGGTVGVLFASATRALVFTLVIGLIVLIIGSIAIGLKPFLSRLGIHVLNAPQDDE